MSSAWSQVSFTKVIPFQSLAGSQKAPGADSIGLVFRIVAAHSRPNL